MTTSHVTRPWLCKLWKQSLCDFVFLEYEHSFFDEARLADFVLCCRSEGLPVVAKVPECRRAYVAKLLESGVTGIQLPWTESREQVDRLVSYVKFPPVGARAAAPGWGNTDYDLDLGGREFVESANRETVVIAHVETRAGIENVDLILSNPHVDVVFIGPYDLSISYGRPGELRHPDLMEATSRVVAAARARGKVVGTWVGDAEAARDYRELGVTFFETLSEVDLIGQGARNHVADLRRAAGRRA
jgi:2-keto-3-deoxy-L-rhamnonate aldolase RhmA